MDDLLPMVLAASGTAAEFCARPEIWPHFEQWLRDGLDGETDDSVTPEFMSTSATVVLVLIQAIERETIARNFSDLLAGI
jgi:hypothetical protein